MKTNFLRRFVAAALAIVMVLAMVPVSPMEVNAVSTTYTLEASSLTAFAQGDKADSDSEVAGTSNFFTIYYSTKSKIDSSNKEFSDGYTSGQRINFGGKSDKLTSAPKNAIKFTTDGPATVKVWWVCGGAERQVSIFNESGSLTAQTFEASGSTASGDIYVSEMSLTDAGTYFLGSDNSSNYLFKIEVTVTTESSAPTTEPTQAPTTAPTTAPSTGSTHVLDVGTDMQAFGESTKADEETEVVNGYFTIHYSAKTKVEDKNKSFSDGYTGTRRLNFNGEVKTTKESVEFTTSDKAVVKIWWGAGDADRQMRILDSTGAAVDTTAEASVKDALYISTLEIPEAGTYFLGGTPKKNYIFKVEVVEGASAEEEPSEPTTEPTAEPTTEPTTAPTTPSETPSYDPSKIDVWDFGAEQLDTNKYNNMLTVDEINSWFPDKEAGTTGVTTGGFTTSDGQMSFVGGGKTNHRLRTTNTALTAYDHGKSLQDADGNVYSGYIYSNASANTGVMIQIAAEAGDILTFVHGSNGGDAVIHLAAPSGAVVDGTFTSNSSAGSKHGQISTFYAAETGTYSFYYSTEKLVVGRIYRQHTNEVSVSGTVTAPAALSGYSLVFTCDESGAVVEAPVSGGTYTATLRDGYNYTVSLKDANGYIITTSEQLAIAAGASSATYDATVAQVDLVAVTGNIEGLDAEALAAMTLTFEADTVYVPKVTVSGTTYSVQLEVGVTYDVVVSGINDYEITSAASVSYTEAASANVTLALKPTYAITIAPTGATVADLANATFTFTNLNEEGYVYEFTGTENIALRDGTYSVKVSNSGIFVQQLTSNLKVAGAAATKTIPFSSDITVWDFSDEDFAGTSPYNGLEFSNGKKDKTYLVSNAGTISVPVKGDCQIKISACYKYSFESDTADSQDQNTGSTSQIDTYTLTYTGEAGYATINVLSQSYITKIEVMEVVEFKNTITVGASGCDYTTINDALDAVRAMERPNNERVTIEIQPGNYEEMLVIDMPNVTLKNASSNPSIELTNKGVDIAANAVRITSYYGHGYSYYSMGSDCKWDETILQVNKENGYESFTNPGSGTTAGSYWNATVVVSGNGFQAEGIIFENSFNQYVSEKAANDVIVAQSSAKEGSTPRANLPVGSTAVQDKAYVERAAALAIANNTNQVSFDNCKFIGRQDTLYGGTGVTAAFYDCSIYGAVDYIMGGMTAVFAKCDLVFNTSEDSNDRGYITAPQTASGSHGLLMYNCNVTSTVPGVDTASQYTSKPGYLGRPWAANTGEAVFYMTVVDAADTHWYSASPSLIVAEGWLNSLSGESALCGEYGTYEYALDVDNSANRASWAAVFETETLASGEPIAIDTWLGDWDAFAGKDLTVEIPTDKVDNKPEEEEPEVPGGAPTVYTFDSLVDVTPGADKDVIAAGTTYSDGYFKVVGSVTQRFQESKGGVYAIEIGKNLTGGMEFMTFATADVKITVASTGGSNTSAVAIVDAEGNVVPNDEGITEVTGTGATTLTYTGLAAGTYQIVSPESEYNRGFRLMTINVEEASAAVTQEYTFDSLVDVTPGADKDAIAAGTTYSDGYFKVVGTVTQRFQESKGGVYAIEIGKNLTGAMEFTTNGTADVTITVASTGGSNTSAVAIVDAEGNVVANNEGITEVTGTAATTLTYTGLAAGTYQIVSPESSYNRGFRLMTVNVVEAAAAVTEEFTFDSLVDVTPGADKDAIAAGTAYSDGYFKVVGTVTQRFQESKGGVYAIEIGKNLTGAMEFTVTGSADVTITVASTSSSNTSAVAIVDAEGNVVANNEGISEVTGTGATTLTYTGLAAGTYQIVSPESSYNRGFRLMTINVTQTSSGERPDRAAWDTVADPVINSAAQVDDEIVVNFDMVIGYDGADSVVVTLYDENGNEAGSASFGDTSTSGSVSIAPTASGNYTVVVTASRADETDKVVTAAETVAYVLPLETPLISSATSNGGGKVNVVWGEVAEATGYNVYCDGVLVGTTDSTEFEVTGLTVGTNYSFTVSALRGEEETAQSAAATATATENAQRVWGFTAYGSSTNTTSNGFVGSVNEDGKVTVYSEGGKGKIVPASTDGVAFYYTAVPAEYNFTLRANVHVDSWTLSNGQEGFGLLATDRLGPNGDATGFWNNSYMAAATKNEYRYDSDTGVFYPSDASYMGTKYSLKLGLTTIAKTGVTPENLPMLEINDSETVNNEFSSVSDTLERYASKEAMIGDSYINNIVGNMTNADSAGVVNSRNLLTDFVLEIQKNNTGYFITYYDEDGDIIRQIKNYDPDALNMVDTENVYVGFFAARNARATFSDIEFSTILASEDAPAEERPITYIEPTIAINSGATSNSVDYTVSLYANVNGTADVSISGVSVAKGVQLIGGERFDIDTKLVKEGVNTIRVYFTPDPDQDLGEYTELASTERIYTYKYISYDSDYSELDYIYVSPFGRDYNPGTKDAPMNIYQAVKYVQPGQTIVLMEGTYKLKDYVRIEPGVDGTPEAPICMIADPEATSRPVLNFQGVGPGMITGGDYWYFQGFDVTNTAPGQKGFQVSGHYNIVDQVNTYNNGNTGLQISRYQGSDPKSEWPSYNLILNCTSYNNSDPGYEDADGFAAKLTSGEGNVFDGCVAYHNADDGWDLYAKVETGPIGAVTIQNCVAYENGYVIENGQLVNAGNGNGFKMGGESISGKHVLKNSYAFFNKAKGIDSNSGPDIIVENSTSYNNESYNVALYTNNAANTDFSATGIVSFKDETIKSGLDTGEQLKPKGTQDSAKYLGDTNYYWSGSSSANNSGATITADDFVSLTFQGVKRNADGTINLQGFLELKEDSDVNAGAGEGGTSSPIPGIPGEPEDPTVPSNPTDPSDPTQPTVPEDPTNPGTGDLGNPVLWTVLMVLAGAALLVFSLWYRKRSFQA